MGRKPNFVSIISIPMRVSVVVPAYNEARRIGAVLGPVVACSAIDEVIVIDDGSEDETAAEAKCYSVRVVSLPENRGKAAALDVGVSEARNDTFFFLDADLVGLTSEHIEEMLEVYREESLDMAVGVFADGRKNTDFAQKINPYASGQRILSRKLWERAQENVEEMNFGIEMALSRLASKEGWRKEYVKLEGVTHILKEEKRGLGKGILERMKMYGDMVKWLFKRL